MRNAFTFSVVLLQVCACSTPSVYERVSRYFTPISGDDPSHLAAGWHAVGTEFATPLSEGEQKRVDQVLLARVLRTALGLSNLDG